MKYLHTMVRVTDIEQSLRFYRDALGLRELSRRDYPQGRYTLVFLAAPGDDDAQVELTHNWDPEAYPGGRNFGHLAYAVDDVYAACRRLMDHGVTINGRRATAAWPSCARRTISRSSCCRRARRWRRRSPGPPCPMSEPGRDRGASAGVGTAAPTSPWPDAPTAGRHKSRRSPQPAARDPRPAKDQNISDASGALISTGVREGM